MEALLQAKGLKEVVKSSRVGFKAFIVQRCSNKYGRFLAVVDYGGAIEGALWSYQNVCFNIKCVFVEKCFWRNHFLRKCFLLETFFGVYGKSHII
jgi:hypothetical protein